MKRQQQMRPQIAGQEIPNKHCVIISPYADTHAVLLTDDAFSVRLVDCNA